MFNTICSFKHLMELAKAAGDAKLSGDIEALNKAQKAHDEYHALCLQADSMNLSMSRGNCGL